MRIDIKDQAIQRGQLSVASVPAVLLQLERYGDQQRSGEGRKVRDQELEQCLLDRNDAEIDLSLARNAGCASTLNALYARGSVDPTTDEPTVYRRALRLAVLSNACLVDTLFAEFPSKVVSDEEFQRIIISGDDEEALALFTNISLYETYIEELLTGAGLFADLPGERHQVLISLLGRNPRLWTRFDGSDMPDMRLYDINKAIVTMLRTAPVNDGWLSTLYEFLSNASPFELGYPDGSIEDVLVRWQGFEPTSKYYQEGYYTGLSLVDEFRCIVAAYYPKFSRETNDGKTAYIDIGVKNSSDPAYRSAYFANAELSAKEVEEYSRGSRDRVFHLAAACNANIYGGTDEVRLSFEERCVGYDTLNQYVRRLKQYAGSREGCGSRERIDPLSEWIRDELSTNVNQAPERTDLVRISSEVDNLTKLLLEQRQATNKLTGYFVWTFVLLGATLSAVIF